MQNYLNTPTSFAFTTQGSSTPQMPSSIKRNYASNQDQQIQIQQYSHKINPITKNQAHILVLNNTQSYSVEDVYKGLINFKKQMIIKCIYYLLNHKIMARKKISFWQLSQAIAKQRSVQESSTQMNLQINSRIFNSILQNIINKNQIKLKVYTINCLIKFTIQQRKKQLNIVEVLSPLMKINFRFAKNQEFRLIQRFWKLQCKHKDSQINKNVIPARSQKYNENKCQFAIKLMLAFINRKISTVFYKLRERANLRKNQNVSTNVNKRMQKMPQKYIESKTQKSNQITLSFSFYTLLRGVIKRMLRGALTKICQYRIQNKEKIKSQIGQNQKDSDSPQIVSNCLRHICWLVSNNYNKQIAKQKTAVNDMCKLKLNALLLKNKRKQLLQTKRLFRTWRQETSNMRIALMQQVKQLQKLKQSYIQNYT